LSPSTHKPKSPAMKAAEPWAKLRAMRTVSSENEALDVESLECVSLCPNISLVPGASILRNRLICKKSVGSSPVVRKPKARRWISRTLPCIARRLARDRDCFFADADGGAIVMVRKSAQSPSLRNGLMEFPDTRTVLNPNANAIAEVSRRGCEEAGSARAMAP